MTPKLHRIAAATAFIAAFVVSSLAQAAIVATNSAARYGRLDARSARPKPPLLRPLPQQSCLTCDSLEGAAL